MPSRGGLHPPQPELQVTQAISHDLLLPCSLIHRFFHSRPARVMSEHSNASIDRESRPSDAARIRWDELGMGGGTRAEFQYP